MKKVSLLLLILLIATPVLAQKYVTVAYSDAELIIANSQDVNSISSFEITGTMLPEFSEWFNEKKQTGQNPAQFGKSLLKNNFGGWYINKRENAEREKIGNKVENETLKAKSDFDNGINDD